MLKITIPASEAYDENNGCFITIPETHLQLEHSLVSISKWEAKWNKPFLTNTEKTQEEIIDYIRCMTLTQNISDNIYRFIPVSAYKEINSYIEKPMTATTFPPENKNGKKEIITSEIIYYWMIALEIPFECQKWHLNRLLTLIKVCSIKNAPEKKMSKNEIISRNKALNAARRAKYNSKG